MPNTLPVGKLPNQLLRSLLRQIPVLDDNLVIAPSLGCDSAGLALDEKYWAVTTDPITFATKEAPRYVLSVNVNDVVCLGCRPRYFLSTILLPEGFTDVALQTFWDQLMSELRRFNIQVAGGHTEVTSAVNIPIIVGQMMGDLAAHDFYDIRKASPGDKILLWRPVSIEGTSLIADERYDDLSKHIPEVQLDTMRDIKNDLGLCVLSAGEKLFPLEGIVGLHDPTEGGIATALHELADASNSGLRIEADKIPILSETKQLAELLKFDPLGLIASGCLLIVCKPQAVESIMDQFKREIIAEIGEIVDGDERVLHTDKGPRELPRFDQDEIVRALKQPLA